MPKKKKNGQSPSRGTRQRAEYGSGPESESRAHGTNGSAVTQADSSWGYSNYFGCTLPSSGQSGSQSRDKVIQGMQEMFSHLDPEVIYMVLSESDFKVENAMDSLLELSNAAEGTDLPPPHVSGFEQAAALLGASHSQTELRSGTAQSFTCSNQPASQPKVIPDETHFTEDSDTLLDQELETFTSQATPIMSSIPLSALPPPSQSIPLSSLPPTSQTHFPAAPTLSELEQLNQESNPECVSVAGSSPVNELSFGGGCIPEQKNISLDFSHLTVDASSGEQRPSAFQVYRRPDQLPTNTHVSAVSRYSEELRTPAMFWNTRAAEFNPRNVGPAFITPVMSNPTPWNMNPISGAQWLAQRPIRQAPLKPSATVPQSWTMPTKKRLKLEGHVLVLLRGAPGSGKTTLAMALLDHNPGGVVSSTDKYFTRNGHYHYEPHLLGEAHEWNQKRAKEAFEKCQTPIIIDNTNMQCWEMKPYVAMAQKYRYRVLFREPDTWWKAKPRELEKRTRHQVSKEKIRHMLDRYDRFVSVQSIMNSHKAEPVPSVVDLTQADAGQPQESFLPGISHPDLVGDSELSKLNPYLSSSLPDVSSVRQMFGTSTGEEEGKMGSFGSKEPMLFCENALEGSGTPLSDLLDGEDLDVELDACLVDTGTSKEKFLEQPVAFSESIDQRVKRDRAYVRSVPGVNIMDRLVNFNSSDGPLEQEKERECENEPLSEDNVVRPELLDFVGDWPMESQAQRQGRQQSSKNRSVKNVESSAVEDIENVSSDEEKQYGTDDLKEAEFQKLIDLLQGNSSPASQHSSFWGGKEEDLTLETRSELPDCVQKFSECTDPSQDLLSSPIPTKQEEQTEQSDPVSAEDTQEKVEEAELAVPADNSSMSPNIQGNQCLRGGLESESSLERRRGLNRRSGKSCKLALTFTNQCPSSPPSQSSVISHLLPDPTPSLVSCSSASTQTHPQDFALIWRIDQHKCTSEDFTGGALVILEGNSLHFNPKTKEEQSACQQGVPYCVVHEKGSQVEENEFKECHSKQYNLEILSRHFRRVSMDILEDLYEKCHQDMEWTTNLLLDSGEQLYKEDEEAELGSLHPVDAEKDLSIEKVMGSDVDHARDDQNVDSNKSSPSSISPKSQETNFSDLSQADDDWSTGQSSQSEAEGSDEGVSMKRESSIVDQPTEDTGAHLEVPVANVEVPNKTDPSQIETIVTESEPVVQCMEGELEEWSEEDGVEKEKEDEEMRPEVDAIAQLLLRQVDEIERKEEEARKECEKERRRTELERRKPNTMYIQTLELKLPTELALQLTELFGPVGVSPDDRQDQDHPRDSIEKWIADAFKIVRFPNTSLVTNVFSNILNVLQKKESK
ncbi:NEDD4-binding protein 2 isoform X2 [Triplophysa rosa]|uniref:NEDD4-binding protein 2 isoform X2 n=1 Tax=Triplophysa rosa TaxID=992332 RepID=UPI0025461857|nr:NEDD4-binding protein 2 isoform X2 [Triplophysa rosa]